MGHNKNQMTWNLENSKASVLRTGISLEVWNSLCAKHFANVAISNIDQAMHNFHNDLKSFRE